MMTLDHIGIYARDVELLQAWYCRVLDLDVVRTLEKPGRPPIYFLQRDGGMVLEILPTSDTGGNRELQDPGLSHLGISVQDHEVTVAHLASKGVVVHDIRHTSAGWTIGYFEDPEGNRLEIVQR
jgi:catechol 2,3-dioxygenase-like lactoylglutathione lyase family enzyme